MGESVSDELTLVISKLSGLALALLRGRENKVNPTDKVAISKLDIFLILAPFPRGKNILSNNYIVPHQ
jgi:hypothetical protein